MVGGGGEDGRYHARIVCVVDSTAPINFTETHLGLDFLLRTGQYAFSSTTCKWYVYALALHLERWLFFNSLRHLFTELRSRFMVVDLYYDLLTISWYNSGFRSCAVILLYAEEGTEIPLYLGGIW